MSTTFAEALSRHDIEIPAHLEAQAEIPVLSGAQVQGDVIITPMKPGKSAHTFKPIPAGGVQVVRGEATRNTHWLDNGNPDAAACVWAAVDNDGLTLGILEVPAGQTALLTHTDEHGSNGIAPGCYRIGRQQQQAEKIERVRD
jgi:hypothetical protein